MPRSANSLKVVERRNSRSLDAIAADIHKAERSNIFQMGKLLLEAKEQQCEHGEWMNWLSNEFGWSARTAENYLKVAELTDKFATVSNLTVPATVIYTLAYLDHGVMPEAIARLEAAVKQGHVTAKQGCQIVELAELRHKHGDLPDATLFALNNCALTKAATAALKANRPTTEAEANEIIANNSMMTIEGRNREPAVEDEEQEPVDQAAKETLGINGHQSKAEGEWSLEHTRASFSDIVQRAEQAIKDGEFVGRKVTAEVLKQATDPELLLTVRKGALSWLKTVAMLEHLHDPQKSRTDDGMLKAAVEQAQREGKEAAIALLKGEPSA